MYNAEISAGSLMPQESKRIAALLLTHPTPDAWDAALRAENLLQKKTLATAKRQSRLIRNRLEMLDETGLRLINTGSQEVTMQILLVAAIKHSQLLSDFIDTVYNESIKSLENNLLRNRYDALLEECGKRDQAVNAWSDSTKLKLYQVLVRILAEAKLIESTRTLRLTPQTLHPEVTHYLRSQNDLRILSLLEPRQ